MTNCYVYVELESLYLVSCVWHITAHQVSSFIWDVVGIFCSFYCLLMLWHFKSSFKQTITKPCWEIKSEVFIQILPPSVPALRCFSRQLNQGPLIQLWSSWNMQQNEKTFHNFLRNAQLWRSFVLSNSFELGALMDLRFINYFVPIIKSIPNVWIIIALS